MQDEFRVRNDLSETDSYTVVNATLHALGENVAIWVDDDLPIDVDLDCDGVIDIPDAYDAFGFNNCDLLTVADIIDSNIVPNVRALFGDESDIDGDGRVSVVITPVLNAITLTSDDDSDYSRVLPSYAEPSVDLQDFDYRTNPGSDEAEVIYVHAPDPYGFFNPNTAPTVEDYTNYQLSSEVARSFTTLVTFNQKVLVGESSAESDWLNDVLGTFAADYCGFGASYYADAWSYLDGPHLFPLVRSETPGELGSLSRGAQYLFGRWLYDYAVQENGEGASAMRDIVQRTDTGTDALNAMALDVLDTTFDELVLRWQIAMIAGGRMDADGVSVVDPSEWPGYLAISNLDAPPADPRGFYGANGYQVGFNVRGVNHAYGGGTESAATELASRAVQAGNTDFLTYVPGFDFNGYIAGNYGAQVVRLVGLDYTETTVEIQSSNEGLVGAVVRWTDPTAPDWSAEDSFSPTDTNAIVLPSLPVDGSPIFGIGRLTSSGTTQSIDEDGVATESDVVDTDRWTLDLRDRAVGSQVTVAAWIERHYNDSNGTLGPSDPWLVIAPSELVPQPTVAGTNSATCADGEPFAYPTSVLEHLYTQVFLSGTLYDGDESELDPCGTSAFPTTCVTDWDRDGVTNGEEPTPSTVYGQLLVMECTANGNVRPTASQISTDNLDVDELDEDDVASYDSLLNVGGATDDRTEDAFVSLSLEGGRVYTVLVGASMGTGTYELTVRDLSGS
jgi:hypothetical protein